MIDNYLFKFFEREEYLEEFQTGKIRLMSAKYYSELESCSHELYNNRFDSTEGKSFLFNSINNTKSSQINFANARCYIAPGVQKMVINGGNEQMKLSCFSLINSKEIINGKFSTIIDSMDNNLGDYFILFKDPALFVNKIQNQRINPKLYKQIKSINQNLVRYYDENTFIGETTIWDKPQGLSWQREYRIVIETFQEKDPFYLDIGNLKNITCWGSTKDLSLGYLVDNKTLYIPNIIDT